MNEKGTVFFPDPFIEATPKDYRLEPYEDVFFPAMDGTRLHGWFVDGPDQRAVLIWFHGNAGNISHRLDNLKRLHDTLHIPIFIFDYREYGLSEGEISKAGTFSDAHGAFRYITAERGFKESSVLLFGRSLGTALAVDLASRHDCLGVILESAFTSTDDMMRLYFPFFASSIQPTTKYDSLALIHRIRSPLLFIHGERDQTIPVAMSLRLHEKARSPKELYVIRGADHNDTYIVGGKAYFDVWRKFLEQCLQRRRECPHDGHS